MPEPRGCVAHKYIDDEMPINWETDPDFMQEWWAESGLGLGAFNARYNSVREVADSDDDDDLRDEGPRADYLRDDDDDDLVPAPTHSDDDDDDDDDGGDYDPRSDDLVSAPLRSDDDDVKDKTKVV